MQATFKRVKPAFAVAALALASASAMAVDLPDFTFNPGAVGLSGTSFTADNFIVSDYGTVTLSGSSFTDTGFLAVSAFQKDSTAVTAGGLNSTYGLYFAYSGAGTLSSAGNPSAAPTSGAFSSLNFSLYGYNGGPATFSPAGTTATGAMLLATGSLMSGANMGSVFTTPQSPSFVAGAGANTSFTTVASGFFASPVPFYNMAVASFINSPSQVTATANGFTIQQGGGSVNFAAVTPVPEPETYALMLAGLGVMGVLARRRRAD